MSAVLFAAAASRTAAEGFVIAAGGGLAGLLTSVLLRASRSHDTCRLRCVHVFVLCAGFAACASLAAGLLYPVEVDAVTLLALCAPAILLCGRPPADRLLRLLLFYAGSALAAGTVRELLGRGTFFGTAVLPESFPLSPVLAEPPSAVLVLCLFCAVLRLCSKQPLRTGAAYIACSAAAAAAAGVSGGSVYLLPLAALAASGTYVALSHPLQLERESGPCIFCSFATAQLFASAGFPGTYPAAVAAAAAVMPGLLLLGAVAPRNSRVHTGAAVLSYALAAALTASLIGI